MTQYMRWNNISALILTKFHYITIDNSLGSKTIPIPEKYINEIIEKNITAVSIICNNVSVSCLPNHITHLMLDFEYNEPIENLPQKLELLYLSDRFNQSLDYLPINLKTLSLGIEFNNPLDNLPPNLETLEMDNTEFDFSLANLPISLKTFICGNNFSPTVINTLPDTIHTIVIHDNKNFVDNIFAILKLPKYIRQIIIFNYNPNEVYDVAMLRKNNKINVENQNYDVIIKLCYPSKIN